MQIVLRANLDMQDVLPEGAVNGQVTLEVDEGITLDALLAYTRLKPGEACMTAVNGDLVVKADRPGRVLCPGDKVTLMAPLRGG